MNKSKQASRDALCKYEIQLILFMHVGASLPAAAVPAAEAPQWDVTDSPVVAENRKIHILLFLAQKTILFLLNTIQADEWQSESL